MHVSSDVRVWACTLLCQIWIQNQSEEFFLRVLSSFVVIFMLKSSAEPRHVGGVRSKRIRWRSSRHEEFIFWFHELSWHRNIFIWPDLSPTQTPVTGPDTCQSNHTARWVSAAFYWVLRLLESEWIMGNKLREDGDERLRLRLAGWGRRWGQDRLRPQLTWRRKHNPYILIMFYKQLLKKFTSHFLTNEF